METNGFKLPPVDRVRFSATDSSNYTAEAVEDVRSFFVERLSMRQTRGERRPARFGRCENQVS
jgi:hypothetical protein